MSECTLFGIFGVLVQIMLVSTCLLFLISKSYSVKRCREKPRRPWLIFSLDTAKQGFSALVAHIMNLMAAVIFSDHQQQDPCVWYFINVMIDTTTGFLLSYALLKILQALFSRLGWLILISGNYKNKVTKNIDMASWAVQVIIWGSVVAISKSLLILVIALIADLLGDLGGWILGPLDGEPELKLVMVMVIIPTVMNVIQFWFQDSFLKGKDPEYEEKTEKAKDTEERKEE